MNNNNIFYSVLDTPLYYSHWSMDAYVLRKRKTNGSFKNNNYIIRVHTIGWKRSVYYYYYY